MNFAEGTPIHSLVVPVPDGPGFVQVVVTKRQHPNLRAVTYHAVLGDYHAARSVWEGELEDANVDVEDMIIHQLVHGVMEEKKMREGPARKRRQRVDLGEMVISHATTTMTERKEGTWQL